MKSLIIKSLTALNVMLLFLGLYFHIHAAETVNTHSRFWSLTAVDTMKYSRDAAGDLSVLQKIPFFMTEAEKLHVTHVTIATPYDQRFYPVLKAWVDGARQHNVKVWFRGNFSSWEGWFGYPKNMTTAEHLAMTKQFILSHPDLFQNGDIFTPVPEPENGGPGDPRQTGDGGEAFNNFLVSSYNTCVSAFAQIHKNVSCGFFSTNADIAKQILTPHTVQEIGNVIVIDNYVNNPQTMQSDLTYLEEKFPSAKIVLGEYGAPIPDINGTMTDSQQAAFITSLLQIFYQNRDKLLGLNYWTLAGGSTELLKNSATETPAFHTIAAYYLPPQITGRITDKLGNPLSGAVIQDDSGKILSQTDSVGKFAFPFPPKTSTTILVSTKAYISIKKTIYVKYNNIQVPNIQLAPKSTNVLYRIYLWMKKNFYF